METIVHFNNAAAGSRSQSQRPLEGTKVYCSPYRIPRDSPSPRHHRRPPKLTTNESRDFGKTPRGVIVLNQTPTREVFGQGGGAKNVARFSTLPNINGGSLVAQANHRARKASQLRIEKVGHVRLPRDPFLGHQSSRSKSETDPFHRNQQQRLRQCDPNTGTLDSRLLLPKALKHPTRCKAMCHMLRWGLTAPEPASTRDGAPAESPPPLPSILVAPGARPSPGDAASEAAKKSVRFSEDVATETARERYVKTPPPNPVRNRRSPPPFPEPSRNPGDGASGSNVNSSNSNKDSTLLFPLNQVRPNPDDFTATTLHSNADPDRPINLESNPRLPPLSTLHSLNGHSETQDPEHNRGLIPNTDSVTQNPPCPPAPEQREAGLPSLRRRFYSHARSLGQGHAVHGGEGHGNATSLMASLLNTSWQDEKRHEFEDHLR